MSRRSKYVLIVLIIVILALLMLQTPLLRKARDAGWSIWVEIIARRLKVGPLTVANNVQEQLDRLVAENVRLKAELEDYGVLRDQMGSKSFEQYQTIKAEVAKPLDVFKSRYIINRGVNDGLVIGAPAVVYGSILVGFVTELNQNTAVLQLVTHPDTQFPGEVLTGEISARGLVRGRTHTGVEMLTIPNDVLIKPDAQVVTVAQENVVPYGLSVGKVRRVFNEEHEPYQKVRLRSLYNRDDIRVVSILVPL